MSVPTMHFAMRAARNTHTCSDGSGDDFEYALLWAALVVILMIISNLTGIIMGVLLAQYLL